MRTISAVLVAALALSAAGHVALSAQVAAPQLRMPSGVRSARDHKTVPDLWMWHMGMLRGLYEIDGVATLEIKKSTGTIRIDGEPCALTNYRASINYWVPGMRVQYSCTTPGGRPNSAIEVVSGQFAWNEDIVGAEVLPGKGTATPNPTVVNERLIRLWSGPQAAAKAAAAGGANTKVAIETGKTVLTYPIPGVPGAMARATLTNGTEEDRPCAKNCAERVEVRQGNSVTEFLYTNYADYNEALNRIDAWFPGHVVEKRDGVTILDLAIIETETGNPYVVMPVPASVRKAGATR
jgi:hypothetical protein